MKDIIKKLNICAVASLSPFINKYPELKRLLNESTSPNSVSEWDFYITVAGIYLISQKKLEIKDMDNQINLALKDLISFLKNNKDENIAIGFWILWNIKREKPTYEESNKLAPAITNFLFKIADNITNKN